MLWLLVDAGIMLACVVAVSLAREHVARLFTERLGLSSKSADVAVLAAAALLAAPFALGAGRLTLRLGDVLSRSALPARGGGHSDLDAAPRRVLRVALELLIVLAVGTPLVALAQPLLPWPPGVLLFPLGIAVLGLVLWRRTAGLEGHVRASAEVVAEALLYPSRRTSRAVSPASGVDPLEQVRELFSGLGEIEVLHLAPSSRAVGRSLSELDLRGLTGASVIAIMREGRMVLPAARELLRAGDQLAFVGTRAAVDAARRLLDE
jgi:CPA2 family monovalent cation:H+ antiporter-2